MEAIIKSIIDLGNKSVNMYGEAFNSSVFLSIQKLFPYKEMIELGKIPGDCCPARLKLFLDKIEEYRKEAQMAQLVFDTNSSSGGGLGGNPPGSKNQDRKSSNGSSGYVTNLVAYKPPKRDEKCRVCNALELTGDTRDLYDNHLHNYITGCPRYIAMTVDERSDICYKARVCRFCHDPTYIFQNNGKGHD